MKQLIENRSLWLIIAGSVIFYLFFYSRQFNGDDWLWLANAIKAWDYPRIFFERPMYGYFRPLNMIWVSILVKIFGVSAFAFSIINIILHSVNIMMLWKVLEKFDIETQIRNISCLFFGFYYLNISAIGWISVGHDIWVVFWSLLFTLKMVEFVKTPGISAFIQIAIFGI